MRNEAQSSSDRSRPVEPDDAAAGRAVRALAGEERASRSRTCTRSGDPRACSRWRWSAGIGTEHRSQRSSGRDGGAARRRGWRAGAARGCARPRSRDRDPHAAVLLEQRHRRELQVLAERPARRAAARTGVEQPGQVEQPVVELAPGAAARRSPRTRCGRRAACRRRSRRSSGTPPTATCVSVRCRGRRRAADRPTSVWPVGACPTSGSSFPSARGSTSPSTSIPSRSGAASSSASRIASSSVDDDAAQPSQPPSSRRCATLPSSRTSSTPPPCDSMYGRTLSSACSTRSASGTGYSPWISSRLATTPSCASASRSLRRVLERAEIALEALAVELEHRRRSCPPRLAAPPDRRSTRAARRAPGSARPGPDAVAISRARSVCAPPSSRGPCRGTCARRTAGTGRSCAPRA